MIESMIKPVGDHLWQRGTNCGGVSCPGGTSCSAASSPGGPSMAAATGSGGTDSGGTGCSMTDHVPFWNLLLDSSLAGEFGGV